MDSYSLLITNVRDRLYRLAKRVVGDANEAEDVVQNVLYKSWQQRDRLLGLDNPPAWLLRMTKHQAIDHLRAHKVRSSRERDAAPADHDGHTPYRTTAAADTLHHIHRTIQALPPNQRRCLQLREIDGLEYQEIATTTGMTLAQVKTNLHRGRQKLRALLTDQNITR